MDTSTTLGYRKFQDDFLLDKISSRLCLIPVHHFASPPCTNFEEHLGCEQAHKLTVWLNSTLHHLESYILSATFIFPVSFPSILYFIIQPDKVLVLVSVGNQ